jgi:hypothetical protein
MCARFFPVMLIGLSVPFPFPSDTIKKFHLEMRPLRFPRRSRPPRPRRTVLLDCPQLHEALVLVSSSRIGFSKFPPRIIATSPPFIPAHSPHFSAIFDVRCTPGPGTKLSGNNCEKSICEDETRTRAPLVLQNTGIVRQSYDIIS